MEERLQKIPVLKIVLSIFFVIILTGIPILHISHAPRIRVEISQTEKIVNLIIIVMVFGITYGIGLGVIIKDIIKKFRRKKVDNGGFFAFWILFCTGALILYMLLGTIWNRIDLRAIFAFG